MWDLERLYVYVCVCVCLWSARRVWGSKGVDRLRSVPSFRPIAMTTPLITKAGTERSFQSRQRSIHTHTHIYIHTQTHTHTYTQKGQTSRLHNTRDKDGVVLKIRAEL